MNRCALQYSDNRCDNLDAENNNVQQPTSDTHNEEKKKYIEKLDADAKKRLEYLLDRAEIYSHFLSDGVVSKSADQKSRSKEG